MGWLSKLRENKVEITNLMSWEGEDEAIQECSFFHENTYLTSLLF